MSLEITHDLREGFVRFLAAGRVTESGLEELGHVLRQVCETNNLQSALIDCQAMEGALPMARLYNATQQFIAAVGPEICVAYINPPDQWRPNDDQFSRDVARNRGGSLELFESEESAAMWLRGEVD